MLLCGARGAGVGLPPFHAPVPFRHGQDLVIVRRARPVTCCLWLLHSLVGYGAGPWGFTPVVQRFGGYLLGDSAYPLLPWLLTPYKTTTRGLNSQLEKCNCAYSQQRVIIGSTFGLLKNRFRRLFYVNEASIKQTFVFIIWSMWSSQFAHSLQWWWGQWWLSAYIRLRCI